MNEFHFYKERKLTVDDIFSRFFQAHPERKVRSKKGDNYSADDQLTCFFLNCKLQAWILHSKSRKVV